MFNNKSGKIHINNQMLIFHRTRISKWFMEEFSDSVDTFNRNDKQLYFNQIRGIITEINIGEIWCSYTLNVGHENPRLVNVCLKRFQYETYKDKFAVGEKVMIRFFLTSRYKHGRWHTNANVLEVLVA